MKLKLTGNQIELIKFDRRLTKILNKYGTKIPDFEKWNPLRKRIYNKMGKAIVKIADSHPKSMKVFDTLPLGSLWNNEEKLNEYWKKYGKKWQRKAKKIYSKMGNSELLTSLLLTNDAHQIVNLDEYFTEITFDFDKIMKSKDPQILIDMYYFTLREKQAIKDLSINGYWYERIKEKSNVDKIILFFLTQMSNEQIVQLASNSNNWEEKLYYYGCLTENNK